jgi:hypothetical protein
MHRRDNRCVLGVTYRPQSVDVRIGAKDSHSGSIGLNLSRPGRLAPQHRSSTTSAETQEEGADVYGDADARKKSPLPRRASTSMSISVDELKAQHSRMFVSTRANKRMEETRRLSLNAADMDRNEAPAQRARSSLPDITDPSAGDAPPRYIQDAEKAATINHRASSGSNHKISPFNNKNGDGTSPEKTQHRTAVRHERNSAEDYEQLTISSPPRHVQSALGGEISPNLHRYARSSGKERPRARSVSALEGFMDAETIGRHSDSLARGRGDENEVDDPRTALSEELRNIQRVLHTQGGKMFDHVQKAFRESQPVPGSPVGFVMRRCSGAIVRQAGRHS